MYKLPSFFCPKSKTKLVRLGQPNDGGYCIPEKSLNETNILFSFGLDDNWSFEEHFKKRSEAKIICFDNNVNNKFWIKKFLKGIIYFDLKKNFFSQFINFFVYFKYKKFIQQKNVYHIKKHINPNNIIVPEPIMKNFINLHDIIKDWGDNCFFLYNSLATLKNSGIRSQQIIMKNYTNLAKLLKKIDISDFKYG